MKMLGYILLMSFLFSLLDWKVIQLTRISKPEWKEWMHSHEQQYALVVHTSEYLLCAPAMALKPLTYYGIVASQASKEQQETILHAPYPTLQGFYTLPVRGDSWTFVPWVWWIIYWLPQVLGWLYAFELIRRRL